MIPSRAVFGAISIVLLLVSPVSGTQTRQRHELPFFSCSTFPATESESDLVTRFGAENVTTALIEGGGAEGEMNPGTVLFSNQSDSRAEIFWKDKEGKRNPEWIRVYGGPSRWRSTAGVTLGTDLLTLEKLNGRPFRLLGFGYDSEGAVTSWAGGKLENESIPGCRFRIWVSPQIGEEDHTAQPLANEVMGDREYSSRHPAMQRLDPRAYQMFLLYE